MRNKLRAFLRAQCPLSPGETLICAVSGGADSVAMLFAFYLMQEELGIRLEAAHFNHHLRGTESQRDEDFVVALCSRYDIPLHIGHGHIQPGEKGLEAAARDARYAFLRGLHGKVATAHTADDNAETVLMRLIRGTGLKGLGAIPPVSGNVIRPMLTVTRREVADFLEEWCLPHVEDSSNESDVFLRNRVRHHILPLLQRENPKIGENLSQMALILRQDQQYLDEQASLAPLSDVAALKALHPALRRRRLEAFLKASGVKEPEEAHIVLTEGLLYTDKPSASVDLPGNMTIARNYGRLEVSHPALPLPCTPLPCPGEVHLPGYRVICCPAAEIVNSETTFTVVPRGEIYLRSRQSGDSIRLPGGSKSLKKLFIDRKIPASQRSGIPIVADEGGILAAYSIGVHQDRAANALPAVTIRIEKNRE